MTRCFFFAGGAFCLRGVLARGGFLQEGDFAGGGFCRRGGFAGGGFWSEGGFVRIFFFLFPLTTVATPNINCIC